MCIKTGVFIIFISKRRNSTIENIGQKQNIRAQHDSGCGQSRHALWGARVMPENLSVGSWDFETSISCWHFLRVSADGHRTSGSSVLGALFLHLLPIANMDSGLWSKFIQHEHKLSNGIACSNYFYCWLHICWRIMSREETREIFTMELMKIHHSTLWTHQSFGTNRDHRKHPKIDNFDCKTR